MKREHYCFSAGAPPKAIYYSYEINICPYLSGLESEIIFNGGCGTIAVGAPLLGAPGEG